MHFNNKSWLKSMYIIFFLRLINNNWIFCSYPSNHNDNHRNIFWFYYIINQELIHNYKNTLYDLVGFNGPEPTGDPFYLYTRILDTSISFNHEKKKMSWRIVHSFSHSFFQSNDFIIIIKFKKNLRKKNFWTTMANYFRFL